MSMGQSLLCLKKDKKSLTFPYLCGIIYLIIKEISVRGGVFMQNREIMPWRRRGLLPKLWNFPLDFDDFFDMSFANPMRTDLRETDTEYILEADLPGYDKKGIEIHYEDGVLTLCARQDDVKEEKAENYLRRERRQGSFSRSIPLPENVNPDAIKASFDSGVLKVVLPKVEPSKEKGRKIAIQ